MFGPAGKIWRIFALVFPWKSRSENMGAKGVQGFFSEIFKIFPLLSSRAADFGFAFCQPAANRCGTL